MTALRLGAGIAVVRLGIFYGAWSLLHYPDERQAFGHVLIILNSLVDLGGATVFYGARARGLGPPVQVAVLIGLRQVSADLRLSMAPITTAFEDCSLTGSSPAVAAVGGWCDHGPAR